MNQFTATRSVTTSPLRWLRSIVTLAALGLGLLICSDDADARFEGSLGFVSGTSIAFDGTVADDAMLLASVGEPIHPGGSLGGLFSRPGLVGGFAAGFLGAGVFGLLFGHGVVGELNGMTSILGLIFQLTLIVMLARLIWTWWRGDKAMAFAELSPRQLADAYGRSRHEVLPDVDPGAHTGPELGEPNRDDLKQKDKATGR